MRKKLLYQLLITIILLGEIQTDLFGQRVSESTDNYNFFSYGNVNESDDGSQGKKSFFSSFDDWPRKKKTIALNVASVATVMAIGTASWDYYSSSFDYLDEGWFGADTKYGGVDKLGHAFSAYALTDFYNNIYKKFGYSDEQAILGGALSSWSMMTLVELGDGFSENYGFSCQDEAMNTVGVGLAYLRNQHPKLKDIFDYRIEWVPSETFQDDGNMDPFTDYSGQKYLIALKPDAILKTDNSLLKALELHFGYYSREYKEKPSYSRNVKRYTYFAVGLNMTYILEQLTGYRFGGIFDYMQIPFTYIPFKYKLD